MKQFIYLDTDMVNSIIAQTEKGLISEMVNETEEGQANTKAKDIDVGIKGTVGGNLFKLAKAEAELNVSGSVSSENKSQLIFKEMAKKTLHDAAYDIAYDQIQSSGTNFVTETPELGNYIELKDYFSFVDLEYMRELFSENGLMDYLKKIGKEEVEENDNQYQIIATVFNVMKQIIPYNRMLVSSDGYIVILEDKYFRDNPKTMAFKHGGEVTCVGLVTNLIGKETEPLDNNIFATLQFQINEALRSMLPSKEDNLFIVQPIAVYYGK